MLKWFDDARMIVAYNGREFDMRVLRRHYDGDEDRWRRHMGKLHDPMTTVTRAAGRRVKLDALLRMNGVAGNPRKWMRCTKVVGGRPAGSPRRALCT